MVPITKPTVRLLASGNQLIAKQMQAKAGSVLPKHLANLESILFIHEGECVLEINGEEKLLKQGDAFVVPPNTQHQIKVKIDFKGLHLMPKEIEFQYFN
ncbi:hypothetical protein OA84_11065 [Kaistella solincola]|jgi:quercetin dioxygenase-like cupin family protein|uniref:Cupin type-2 domain-containing protein n=1 Tax=Kaistella solincola TaxID=510955 RepID=A0ABR4ZN58_9FLAO|nr:cupin domain-containing protein [Kaistella solincola]KIA82318.1 hypothetical protein OA84_11065 [Kaistella solincola]